MVDYWFAPRDVDFTPFTDTVAAAALHVVGQLPYSWFVKLFEINRYMLKIFTQKKRKISCTDSGRFTQFCP